MLQSKKLTLALLINAALVSTAFASEQSESKGFVEDANGSVLFRTGYLARDYKDVAPDTDTSSFAQTAIIKLDSGFTKGVVGFGAGIIGDASFKLGENAHTGNGMIPTHNDGSAYDHWARGGAYVKARISNTTATYGTQVLDLPVLASNTARLVPEYFTGVLVQSNEIDNLNLVAGKFTENQYSSQINSDGNQLDRAVVWGAKYTFNDDLKASYYGVDVKDKLDRHYANVNYNHGLKDDAALNFDLSGYHTKFSKDASTYSATGTIANTAYGTNAENGGIAGTEKTNDIWAISTSYSKDVHNVMLAYQQNFGDVGYDYGGNADGAQSIYLPNSYLSDFVGNDEKSLGLQYNYNFKNHGLPGLNWTTAFVYGWDIDVRDQAKDGQEREFFNQVKYTVQSGFAKDVSLRLRHSYYRANDEYKSVYMPDTNEWRIWLDIPVKLF
ncbi:OprD family outer membrane porin [Acinetobacter towneri]|uniref:OprD family outer membrane porin n=1 Tax=Acinetobacter towneri TaxID=202956 RepID=A0ABX7TDC3_9GAMM|nr:OprD family outer membrane porin [Acinetobacter towneri]QTD59703.1 OprD family outer membrane porin [Acinetobacter towneri]QTD61727.1 OprD family outer membrane porin [Acinetobacter towneri]